MSLLGLEHGALPASYWWLWTGQLFARTGTLAPGFLVLFLQEERGLPLGTTSLALATFSGGLIIAGLAGGAVADRIGHRTTILVAQPVAVLTALLLLWDSGPAALVVLSLVAGLATSIDRPAGAALIAGMVGRQDYAKAYGLYLMGFNVGMSVGPVLAGLLLDVWAPGLFLLWATTSALFFVCALFVRPVVSSGPDGAPVHWLRGLVAPYRDPHVATFLVLCFVVALVYLQMSSTLPVQMAQAGLSGLGIGALFAVNAVIAICMLPFVARILGGWDVRSALALAALLVGIGFGLNAFAQDWLGFLIPLVVWTLGEVIWAPMSSTLLANRAPEGLMSSYQSSFFLAWNLALLVGGPAGLWVVDVGGYAPLWTAAFVLGAVASLGFVVSRRLVRTPSLVKGTSS